MAFVIAAPDLVTVAATDLANIGSTIGAASSAAAGSTTAVLPAAEDEVSAAIAALFGVHGRMFQVLSTQAAAFHEQFVRVLNAAAGAYASTEAAGVAPLQGAPSVTGVVAALQNGSAALGPGLLAPAAGTGLASIAGPYETLFANTAANLRTLEGAIAANPAPFLRQFLLNQIGYAREIAAGAEYVLQNLPTVLANLPANIRAAVQALLAFNPAPVIQQFIANQLAYAQIIATSLQNAAHDFVVGLEQLPAAFQSAVQALMAGNVGGAVSDIAQGFLGLFVTGVDVTTTGDPLVAPGLAISVTPTGTLGNLLPILTIPGMAAQNFTNLLPPDSIPAQVSQNFTNVIGTLTNTSISANGLIGLTTTSPFVSATLTGKFGLPVVLAIDALGAPVNAGGALGSSATTFIGDLQTGNPIGAIATLIDAPAVVTDAFLNGQTTIPLSVPLPDFSQTLIPAIPPFVPATTLGVTNGTANLSIPLDGLLVPQTPITASITGTTTGTGILAFLNNQPITVPVDVVGTPFSGLAAGLLVYAPEQLALAITPSG